MTAPAQLRQYYVTWEIDIFDVEDPLEAARAALDIQRDPASQATVFTVHSESGSVTVDINVDGEANSATLYGREFGTSEVSA